MWELKPYSENLNWVRKTESCIYNPKFYKYLFDNTNLDILFFEHPDHGVLPLLRNEKMYYAVTDVAMHNMSDFPVNDLFAAMQSFPYNISIKGVMGNEKYRDGMFMSENILFPVDYTDATTYYNCLNNSNRSDLRKVNDKGASIIHILAKPNTKEWRLCKEWLASKWKNDPDTWHEYLPVVAEFIMQSLQGQTLCFYDEYENFLGVNISECVGETIHDLFSSRNPLEDKEYSLGKLFTNRNIEESIKTPALTKYNLGSKFPYKTRWIPKETPAHFIGDLLVLKDVPGFDAYPPYYINEKLIADL